MKSIATVFAILAAFLLTDLHWCAMQSITWASMISTSNQGTLTEKVSEVLSGENPCEHCTALKEGLDSEEKEILEMLTKSVTLSPIEICSLQSHRHSKALFRLASPKLRESQFTSSGIEHPPRHV